MKNVINLIGIFLLNALLFSSCNNEEPSEWLDEYRKESLDYCKEAIVGDWFAFTPDGRFVDIITFSPSGGYISHEYSVEGNVKINSNGDVNADCLKDYGTFKGTWRIENTLRYLQLVVEEDGCGGKDGISFSNLMGRSTTAEIDVEYVKTNYFIVEFLQGSQGAIDTSDGPEIVFIRMNSDYYDEPCASTGSIQGHEFVDLGLSVNWAACNIGANSQGEKGEYYAWGEIMTKNNYIWGNYKWCDGDFQYLTKYYRNGYGVMDNIVLSSSDDVATVKWGDKWRLPTKEEIDELCNRCTWRKTTMRGVLGYIVTGPNGNSIFLPDAGVMERPLGTTSMYYDKSEFNDGIGHYWSSTVNDRFCTSSYVLRFCSRYDWYRIESWSRVEGCSVRPVTKSREDGAEGDMLKEIIVGDWYAFAYDERFVDVVSFSEDGSYKAHEYNAEGNVTVDDNGNVDADWIRDYGKFNGSWKITGDNLFLQEDGKGGRDGNSYSCLVEINPGKIQSVEENKFVVKYIIKAKDMNGEVLEFEYLTTFIRLGSSGSNDENEKPEESDKTTGEIQGHEWVDLGLSVKWATCNVGAESPEEYGGCYTWSSTDDIATKKWGSKWRMPTKEEFEELSEDCTWKWTTKDGVNGYEVKGDNGNSIFLPAAGYYYGSSRQEDGETGYYWSSTPYQNNSRAYGIDFNEEGRNIYRYALSYEQSVRPVCE